MLPNFMFIGAMKSDTTNLSHQLSLHLEIFFREPKEPCLFSSDNPWQSTLSLYKAHFDAVTTEKAIGEGSINYSKLMGFPRSAERIYDVLVGGVQIIYVVRNTFDQIRFKWLHMRVAGMTTKDFRQSMLEDAKFIGSANYRLQIEQYRRLIPDEQIKVLFFEGYVRDPFEVLRDFFAFLGVNETFDHLQVEKTRTSTRTGGETRWC